MSSSFRFEAALGALTLDALRARMRRSLGARVREHHDARGRITPYLEVGHRRRGTLVWLHGFSDRFDTILMAAPHLVEEWRIVSPSVPAFGEGWVDPEQVHTFDAFADWMEAFVRDEVTGPFHLMGNSLGGAIALTLAARKLPGLSSVVALNTAGIRIDGVACAHAEMEGGDNLFEVRSRDDYLALQRRVFARPAKLPRWVATHLYDESRRHADWYVRLGHDLSQSDVRAEGDGWVAYVDLPAIEVPTLALWGDEDSLFPPAHGELIAEVVEHGAFERLEGVGHCPHLESPRRLAEAFRRWAHPSGASRAAS